MSFPCGESSHISEYFLNHYRLQTSNVSHIPMIDTHCPVILEDIVSDQATLTSEDEAAITPDQ